jgi:hypothetical protein
MVLRGTHLSAPAARSRIICALMGVSEHGGMGVGVVPRGFFVEQVGKVVGRLLEYVPELVDGASGGGG